MKLNIKQNIQTPAILRKHSVISYTSLQKVRMESDGVMDDEQRMKQRNNSHHIQSPHVRF